MLADPRHNARGDLAFAFDQKSKQALHAGVLWGRVQERREEGRGEARKEEGRKEGRKEERKEGESTGYILLLILCPFKLDLGRNSKIIVFQLKILLVKEYAVLRLQQTCRQVRKRNMNTVPSEIVTGW